MSVGTTSTGWRMSFLLALGVVCLAHAEGEYTVTILTDSNEPYVEYGSAVQFTCLLEPPPPEPAALSYQWRYITSYYGGQSSGQNLTFSPYNENLRFCWFFCHVYSNDTLLSIGKKVVEVNGIFSSPLKPVQHYSNGDMLTMRTSDIHQYYSEYVYEVAWYHNGSEISSDERVMIGRGTYDKEFNITDLRSSDAGVYQMKVTALTQYGIRDPVCDSLLLPLIENQAIFAPVTFTLRESTECKIEEYSSLSLQPPTPIYYSVFQNGGELVVTETIHLPVQLNLTVFLDRSDHQWFHNGEAVSSDGTKYNSAISASGDMITAMLVITNITETDSGLYTLLFYIRSFYLLRNVLLDCRYDRYFFMYYLNLNTVITGVLTTSIEKYESPVIQFSLSISEAENTLQCRVVGGNPATYNHKIMLTKNRSTVTQTYGDHLFYNSSNEFGVYTCTVESLHSNDNKTLYVPERVTFNILINMEEQCQQQSGLEDGENINSILMSMMAVIEEQCDCTLSLDNFEGTQMSCLGYGSYSLFTSTLIFSDSEGSVLASDLIRILQSQIKVTNGQLASGQLNVVFPSDSPLPTSAGLIAGVLVGGWILGILTLALAMGIGLCVLRNRANIISTAESERGNTDTQHDYITSNDVKMDTLQAQTNAAYEIVSKPRPVRPRQQETAVDEPAYENMSNPCPVRPRQQETSAADEAVYEIPA